MKKAGVAVVIIGVLLMLGGLYVARTVESSTVKKQFVKSLKVELTRENCSEMLGVIDSLTDEGLTDDEKMAQVSQQLDKEYTQREAIVIIGSAKKLFANGLDGRTRLSLMLHPYDQVMNVVGMLAVLVGGAMAVLGGKRKLA